MVIRRQWFTAAHSAFGGICKGCGKPVIHVMTADVKPGANAAASFPNGEVCCPSCGYRFESMVDVTAFESYEEAMNWVFDCLGIEEGKYYTYSEQRSYCANFIRSKAFEKATADSSPRTVAALDTDGLCGTKVRVDTKVAFGKRCEKCGFENSSGSRFCIYCGSPFSIGSRLTGN